MAVSFPILEAPKSEPQPQQPCPFAGQHTDEHLQCVECYVDVCERHNQATTAEPLCPICQLARIPGYYLAGYLSRREALYWQEWLLLFIPAHLRPYPGNTAELHLIGARVVTHG